MTGPVIVTMRDIRGARQCSRGARAFFERHGLDFNDFLINGIPVEKLEATGDAMAKRVCEVARGR